MARPSRKSLNPYKFLSDVPVTFDKRVVPHKKRHCTGTSATHRGEPEPLLSLDTCIVCEVSDQWVTRCSGIDCVISFHRACLYPDFDSSSEHVQNPHCPFCWLRILTGKSKTLREKVVVADKAVFKYLDKDIKSRDENSTLPGDRNGIPEHSVGGSDIGSDQELLGEKDAYLTKETQLQVEKGFDKSRRENLPLIDLTNQPEEDIMNLEVGTDEVMNDVGESEDEVMVLSKHFQDAEICKDNDKAKDQTQARKGAGKKGYVSQCLSMQELCLGKEHDQVQQKEKPRRRRLIMETSSIESSSEQNGEDVTEQVTSSNQVTSPSCTMKNQMRKANATTKVVANKSKTVRDISSLLKKEPRKKLPWTFLEEEMLKEGVEKFAAIKNKNMPWRKILEMGEKVFDETRTPSDLKDKWRRMVAAIEGKK